MRKKIVPKMIMMLAIACAFVVFIENLNGASSNELLEILSQGADYNLSKIQAGKGMVLLTVYSNGEQIEREEVFSAFEKDKLRWDKKLARYAIDGSKTIVYSPGNNSANFKDINHYKNDWIAPIAPLQYGVTLLGLHLSDFIKANKDIINFQEGKLGEEKVYILEISYPQDKATRRVYVTPNKGFCIVRAERCIDGIPYILEETDLKEYPNGAWFFDKYTYTTYKIVDGKVDSSVWEWKRELKILKYELCENLDDSIFTLKGLGAHGEVTIIDRTVGDVMYSLPIEIQ
jgi:hypothetical protein